VAIQIVGEQWTPRSHQIRDLLDRNAIPYQFQPHDSQAGRQLLREHGQDGSRLPVLVLFDGRVLVDPTNAEGAAALGVATRPEPGRYDLLVIGAGPAGLSAATYGASEGLRTLLLEPEALGGQAGSSALIRNYLGFRSGSPAASSPSGPRRRRSCSARSWSMPARSASGPLGGTASSCWPMAARRWGGR
jgi:thioredoxin reductase (NADPH)